MFEEGIQQQQELSIKNCRVNDGQNDRKATLQALHTDAVDKAVKSHERNVVLDGRPTTKQFRNRPERNVQPSLN